MVKMLLFSLLLTAATAAKLKGDPIHSKNPDVNIIGASPSPNASAVMVIGGTPSFQASSPPIKTAEPLNSDGDKPLWDELDDLDDPANLDRLEDSPTTKVGWGEYVNWDLVPVSSSGRIYWKPCKNVRIGWEEDEEREEEWWERQDQFLIWECARLEFPLDYDDLSAGTLITSFVKLNGNKSLTHDTEAENILVHTGRAGDSVLDDFLANGHQYRFFFGTDVDIITFDPRGVHHSSPLTDCWAGDRVAQYRTEAALSATNNLSQIHDIYGKWGDRCRKNLKQDVRYIGTPAVARDMLEFLIRTGAEKIVDKPLHPDDVKLNFYGGDYGAVLGATFATLYPKNAGQIILDSPYEHYNSGIFGTGILNYDKTVDNFFTKCVQVGRLKCPYWEPTVPKLKRKFERLLRRLKEEPYEVPIPASLDEPVYITDQSIIGIFGHWTQFGSVNFGALAHMLYIIEVGEARGAGMMPQLLNLPQCSKCRLLDWLKLASMFGGWWGPKLSDLITCVDTYATPKISSVGLFQRYMDWAKGLSRYRGEFAAYSRAACHNWPFEPPPSQQFDGVFGGDVPMLILGNWKDPRVPESYLRQMVRNFTGSTLLLQEDIGHGTFNLVSWCTRSAMERFMFNNSFPITGTICQPGYINSLDYYSENRG